ncbi:uncharacterized protein P174DRAFT_279275 [Aspergillus novofumigatus IBT 16806]|uniref:Uncharacterized protein n=1 Tax=Aspergillus novofumigatus (strain IBT 16806) TaxID=1392255 RepID=A0A2I1BZZ9_ASPN1|nr:uncharacterized protein P174DRAFT_279275 [Aspergillus novofumigatus IBT 16806]PKX90962.1 hypothetical protein P174DRAFT_279275 [Aspergillus novofumigatus IBT 16806]
MACYSIRLSELRSYASVYLLQPPRARLFRFLVSFRLTRHSSHLGPCVILEERYPSVFFLLPFSMHKDPALLLHNSSLRLLCSVLMLLDTYFGWDFASRVVSFVYPMCADPLFVTYPSTVSCDFLCRLPILICTVHSLGQRNEMFTSVCSSKVYTAPALYGFEFSRKYTTM